MNRQELLQTFERVFECRLCDGRLEKPVLNPYIGHNCKHDPPNGDEYAEHRRDFLRAYINNLDDDACVMIVGEAPGLDGCGFCGIAFTAEANAILDQGLPSYHATAEELYQTEASATVVYAAMIQAADQLDVPAEWVFQRVLLTNACLCVPIKPGNPRSIRNPDREMEQNCHGEFLDEVVTHFEPSHIIAVGKRSLCAFGDVYDFTPKTLRRMVEDRIVRRVGPNRIPLVAEVHPSPRNRNNPSVGHLWPEIQNRLTAHLVAALRHA